MAAQSDSAPSAGFDSVRPRVLYVMGAGRSGSTILGVTLGNCDRVFFAGELDKWLTRRGAPKLAGAERERFWHSVLEQVEGADELFGFAAHRYLERSSALLRPRRLAMARRLRPGYRRLNERLYRAIAGSANASHVLDSSHYPLRARELQSVPGIELYLLFLVREPHNVVASLDRDDVAERRFGTLTANLYLWLTHALCLLTFLRQPRSRRLLVSHEDFLRDPAGVVRSILDQAGCASPVPDLDALSTGFPLVGNRLIDEQVVRLRVGAPDPASRRLLTTIMQAPLRPLLAALRPRTSSAQEA